MTIEIMLAIIGAFFVSAKLTDFIVWLDTPRESRNG